MKEAKGDRGQNLLEQDRTLFHSNLRWLIGADEAGRGPLAGPVMAGAVALRLDFLQAHSADAAVADLFHDSKQLSAEKRQHALDCLQVWAQQPYLKFAWGEASVEEIEKVNILQATTLAFQRALEQLQALIPEPFLFRKTAADAPSQATRILVDGYPLKNLPYHHQGVVKGDRTYFCIAAASIVAKVLRDERMMALAQIYPAYHFEVNKGYGTEAHIAALKQVGPCPVHRPSFLKKLLGPQQSLLDL